MDSTTRTTMTMLLRHEVRCRRKIWLGVMDTVCFLASYLFSWAILSRRIDYDDYTSAIWVGCVLFLALFLLAYTFFKMYDSLWRYAGFVEYLDCIYATAIAGGLFFVITSVTLSSPQIPITVKCLSPIMAGMATLSCRMFYRAWRAGKLGSRSVSGLKKVIIAGAGNAGLTVSRELMSEQVRRYEIVGFVDDAPHLRGAYVMRIRVLGTTDDIPKLVKKYEVDTIIIAIPSATQEQMHRIATICEKTGRSIKKIPSTVLDFVTKDTPLVKQMRDVSVADLLGRSAVDVNINRTRFLEGKTVLITGAGGSIGSELCRQAVIHGAKHLIMLDICENGLYDIQQELLRKRGHETKLCAEVASIRGGSKLDIIFDRYKPDIVYHAAAHKHVPLMEFAPEEAAKNNVFGTLNVARCADRHGVKRFVMISTDKAVNPTSVMGATKRVCEMIIQSMNTISKTEFVAVRFGNVLGSNGSVIPLFKKQIKEGGPVTVTDERITRYFMTIPEAVGLVMTAGEMAKGGEIFVLDMGEPIKIIDLARTMIKLSGYEPDVDIDIEVTGLRPGEKLYEELLTDKETLTKTLNNKIFVDKPIDIKPDYLFEFLSHMKAVADANDTDGVIKDLKRLIPEFTTEKRKDTDAA